MKNWMDKMQCKFYTMKYYKLLHIPIYLEKHMHCSYAAFRKSGIRSYYILNKYWWCLHLPPMFRMVHLADMLVSKSYWKCIDNTEMCIESNLTVSLYILRTQLNRISNWFRRQLHNKMMDMMIGIHYFLYW